LSVEELGEGGRFVPKGSFALKITAMFCYIDYDVSNPPLVPPSEDVL
jgi:hypothetical protein